MLIIPQNKTIGTVWNLVCFCRFCIVWLHVLLTCNNPKVVQVLWPWTEHMQPTCIRHKVTGTVTQLELQFLAAVDKAGRSWVYRIKVHVIFIIKAAAAFGNIHTAHLIFIWDFIYLNVEIFCTSIWYFNSFCCWCTQMWNIFLWQNKYLLGNLSSVKQYNADVIIRYETSKFI